jgi:protein-S-isoprenylcysteine O-methyltransferase Ste14
MGEQMLNSRSVTMPGSDINRQRVTQWIATAALTVLYGAIAGSWASKATAAAFGHDGSNVGWGYRLLQSANGYSTALFYFIVAAIMLRRRPIIHRERRITAWILPTIAMIAIAIVGRGQPTHMSAVPLAISTIFVMCGAGFTIYSLRHLGTHFGVVSDVRGLVTTGPYRYVRHPLYAGENTTTLGIVCIVASPITVGAFVVSVAIQYWRARVEEQALRSVFPQYADYARSTPMIIPLPRVRRITAGSSLLPTSSGD